MTRRSLAYTSAPWVPKRPSRGLWLAVGAGIGVAVGVAIDALAISLAIGVAMGAALDFYSSRN